MQKELKTCYINAGAKYAPILSPLNHCPHWQEI